MLKINETDSLQVEYITSGNNETEAVLFIDVSLRNKIPDVSLSTIFVDGTFATVPQIKTHNCQLWTILIRHSTRV